MSVIMKRSYREAIWIAFGLIFATLSLNAAAQAPSGTSFVIYHDDGSPADIAALVGAADTVDVVLIGEVHTDPAAKELALELGDRLQARSEANPPVVLSLEIFERDVQTLLDEYLAGLINEEHFLADSRPWSGYRSQYSLLVNTAREEGWKVIAANPPRRYVNRVAREGVGSLEDLSESARKWLPPLPYAGPSSAYRDAWIQLMQGSAHGRSDNDESDDTPSHHPNQFEDMMQAQALWDAGMAHSIARQLMRAPSTKVVHLAGSFHVEDGTGIEEHLMRYRPGTSVLSVTVRPVDDPAVIDDYGYKGRADFVILSDQQRLEQPPS